MDIIYEIPAALEPEDLIPRSLITIRDFYCLLFGVSFNLTLGGSSITRSDSPQIKEFIHRCSDGFRDQKGNLGKVIIFEKQEEFHLSYQNKLKASSELDKIIKEAVSVGSIQSIPNKNQDFYYSKATKMDMHLFPNLADGLKLGLIDGCHAQMSTYDNKKFSQWFYENVFEWLKSKQFISEDRLRIVEFVLLKILKKDVKTVSEKIESIESDLREDATAKRNQEALAEDPGPGKFDNKTKEQKEPGRPSFPVTEEFIRQALILKKNKKINIKDLPNYPKLINTFSKKKINENTDPKTITEIKKDEYKKRYGYKPSTVQKAASVAIKKYMEEQFEKDPLNIFNG